MNWRMIFTLSGFGVAMGLASVRGLTGRLEPPIWLATGIFCGVCLARRSSGRRFLHAFLVGLMAGAIATIIQTLLFDTLAPIAGLLNGVAFGLIGWVTARFLGTHAAPGAAA